MKYLEKFRKKNLQTNFCCNPRKTSWRLLWKNFLTGSVRLSEVVHWGVSEKKIHGRFFERFRSKILNKFIKTIWKNPRNILFKNSLRYFWRNYKWITNQSFTKSNSQDCLWKLCSNAFEERCIKGYPRLHGSLRNLRIKPYWNFCIILWIFFENPPQKKSERISEEFFFQGYLV